MKGTVESDVLKEVFNLWTIADKTVGKETIAVFKKFVGDMQSLTKEAAESLGDITKNLSALPLEGHLDKIAKSADVLFIHPEEHVGETGEAEALARQRTFRRRFCCAFFFLGSTFKRHQWFRHAQRPNRDEQRPAIKICFPSLKRIKTRARERRD